MQNIFHVQEDKEIYPPMYLREEQTLLRELHHMQNEQNTITAQFLEIHILINQKREVNLLNHNFGTLTFKLEFSS